VLERDLQSNRGDLIGVRLYQAQRARHVFPLSSNVRVEIVFAEWTAVDPAASRLHGIESTAPDIQRRRAVVSLASCRCTSLRGKKES